MGIGRIGSRSQILSGVCFALSVVVASAQAPAAGTSLKDVYNYQGADRDQKLLAMARKEGVVTLYTSLNLKDSLPITEAFEKKYGIKVSVWRGGSEKVVQRSVTEARAKRFTPDVYETNGPEMEILYRENLLDTFFSPSLKNIPAAVIPAHRQWVPDRLNFFVLAYNTKLVKPEEVPARYEDLLQPRWAGKIGIEAADTDWFAAVVHGMGEEKGLEYFRRLSEMKPQLRTGHTLIVELIASGEIPIAIAVYNHAVERLVQKGAPIRWKALETTYGRPNAIGVSRHAQHPYAGLLFVDFMLSKEGQELIKQHNRVPSNSLVDSPLNKFPYRMIDPVWILDEGGKWEKRWSDLFLKGQAIGRGKE